MVNSRNVTIGNRGLTRKRTGVCCGSKASAAVGSDYSVLEGRSSGKSWRAGRKYQHESVVVRVVTGFSSSGNTPG